MAVYQVNNTWTGPPLSGASPLPHLDLIGCQGLHTPFVRADAAMYKAKRLGKPRYRGLDSVKMWEGACSRWRCISLAMLD